MRPDRLKRFAILAELNEEDREALVELLEERRLPAGKSAFREGAEAEGLVLLVEGRLRLKSRRTGGVVGTIEACQHLGAASLFTVGPREVTAQAEGPCTIWLLPRSALPRLADDAPRTAFRLAEAVASELADLARRGVAAAIDGETGGRDE